MKRELITSLFVGSIVASNFLAAKVATVSLPIVGSATFPAGIIAIAVAFLMSDILVETESEAYAKKVVNSSVVTMVVVLLLAYISVVMPAAPFYTGQEAFSQIVLSSVSISLASVTTILLSQHLDVAIFSFLKKRYNMKFIRNIGSTVTSQFIDTTVFILLGFVVLPTLFGSSAVPLATVGSLILSQYVVKVLLSLIDTPFFYLFTR